MDIIYYPYFVRAHAQDFILIWFNESDKDKFFKFGGKIYKASNKSDLEKSLPDIARCVNWDDANAKVDVDSFTSIIDKLEAEKEIEQDICERILEMWNFFDDFLYTLNNTDLNTHSDILNHMYNKIFYGNNLDAVTPKGEHYNPILTQEELVIFKGIMIPITSTILNELK